MRTKDLEGGVRLIDTALNYAMGQAQTLLAPALAAHPSLRMSAALPPVRYVRRC